MYAAGKHKHQGLITQVCAAFNACKTKLNGLHEMLIITYEGLKANPVVRLIVIILML